MTRFDLYRTYNMRSIKKYNNSDNNNNNNNNNNNSASKFIFVCVSGFILYVQHSEGSSVLYGM